MLTRFFAGLVLLLSAVAPGWAQRVFPSYFISGAAPYLAGRAAAGDVHGDGQTEVLLTGQDENGNVFTRLYTFGGETIEQDRGGNLYYLDLTRITSPPLEPITLGTVLMQDFDGDSRDELLLMGTRRPTVPYDPVVALYTLGPGNVLRPLPTGDVAPLLNSGAAFGGGFLATSGRLNGALVTQVFQHPTLNRVADLPGVEHPALAWGDCDGDNDLDLAYSGVDAQGVPQFHLFRNAGGTFTEVATAIPGTFGGGLAFADLNGDGADELAVTGSQYGPAFVEGLTALYSNDGACGFTRATTQFPPIAGHSIAFGDENQDGRLDLLVDGLDGELSAVEGHTFIFSQRPDGSFEATTQQAGSLFGNSLWLDVNGDGLLDVLSMGVSLYGTPILRVYRNPSSCTEPEGCEEPE